MSLNFKSRLILRSKILTVIFFFSVHTNLIAIEHDLSLTNITKNETYPSTNKESIELSITSLDNAWNNRETLEGQKIILAFIKKAIALPNDFEITWRISRLVYFIANFGLGESLNNSEKMSIFEYGYKAGEIAKNLKKDRVEGYYWFAINLGKYSLAKSLFYALRTAPTARDALLQAAKLDPTYHWAGPYRILGQYYQKLPSTISFGDRKKAEEYYHKAIELAPKFRVNTTYLAARTQDTATELKLFEEAEKKPDLDGKIEEMRYKKIIENDIKEIKE